MFRPGDTVESKATGAMYQVVAKEVWRNGGWFVLVESLSCPIKPFYMRIWRLTKCSR